MNPETQSIDKQIKALEAEKASLGERRTRRAWVDPEARKARMDEIEAELKELNEKRLGAQGKAVGRAIRF